MFRDTWMDFTFYPIRVSDRVIYRVFRRSFKELLVHFRYRFVRACLSFLWLLSKN